MNEDEPTMVSIDFHDKSDDDDKVNSNIYDKDMEKILRDRSQGRRASSAKGFSQV
jgi:hypothetical protein